jgi:hypothetical protein
MALLILCAFLLLPGSVSAQSIQDFFTRTGQSESLTAPLTVFGGTTTVQQWSGLIEVILSGEAINNPPTGLHVDPFYAFFPADPTTIQGTGTRFRISSTGCAASFECNAPDIILFLVFTNGIGFVTPPNVADLDPMPIEQLIPIMQQIIPYTTTHTYHFVIDVGPGLKFLTMGDGDGGVFDNSGQFNVQLYGVTNGVAFASFTAQLDAKLNGGDNDDRFDVHARFTLGTGNNGINPLTEEVIIQVGTFVRTIPAGSFTRDKKGVFKFNGVIDGVPLQATIKPASNGFDLDASATGANVNESKLPLTLSLRLGNDIGTATLSNSHVTAQTE